MQCNYNSFIKIINFHGFFRNALRCRKTGACRILVPLRYNVWHAQKSVMISFSNTFNGIETNKLIQMTSATTAIKSDFQYRKANKLHTGTDQSQYHFLGPGISLKPRTQCKTNGTLFSLKHSWAISLVLVSVTQDPMWDTSIFALTSVLSLPWSKDTIGRTVWPWPKFIAQMARNSVQMNTMNVLVIARDLYWSLGTKWMNLKHWSKSFTLHGYYMRSLNFLQRNQGNCLLHRNWFYCEHCLFPFDQWT